MAQRIALYMKGYWVLFTLTLGCISGALPRETFSASCYRRGVLEGSKVFHFLMRCVDTFPFEKGHCENAYWSENR